MKAIVEDATMDKRDIYTTIQGNEELYTKLALDIWNSPEVAFHERESSRRQKEVLRSLGFSVRELDDIQGNAFIAEYGQDRPTIGFLGEFDALPGMSQKATTIREALVEGAAGHGCGHNLLGTASIAAAAAIKTGIQAGSLRGRVRYFGCPAEEVFGKVALAKAGVFRELDAVLCWHPADVNMVAVYATNATVRLEFRFTGKAAHAAQVPHLGRSALDSLTLMNVGAEFLREHVSTGVRIHYVVTSGGEQPNVVPGIAAGLYQIRAPRMSELHEVMKRLIDVARGAALMAGTTMEYHVEYGCHGVVPNKVLSGLLLKNFEDAPPCEYDEDDVAFATALAATTARDEKKLGLEMLGIDPSVIEQLVESPLHTGIGYWGAGWTLPSSTDVGDVSHLAPTGQILAAVWPIGTGTHTWQATAASGSRIGMKGMLFAAKVMAGTAWDLLNRPSSLIRAKEEFDSCLRGEAYDTAESLLLSP